MVPGFSAPYPGLHQNPILCPFFLTESFPQQNCEDDPVTGLDPG